MIHAQQRFVVVDMETKAPLRDVTVRFPSGEVTTTKWDGTFSFGATTPADSAASDTAKVTVALSKPGYLGRKMDLTQRTDTIELLPSYNKLSEVVVWGIDRQHTISFSLSSPTKDEIAEIAGPSAGIGIGDVMRGIENLINHKKRKRAKKIKESLDKY